jgi:hypothetical protein
LFEQELAPETPVLENVSEEIGTIIENVWPELISKLPSKLFKATNRIVGLVTASQIASASAASVLLPLDVRA